MSAASQPDELESLKRYVLEGYKSFASAQQFEELRARYPIQFARLVVFGLFNAVDLKRREYISAWIAEALAGINNSARLQHDFSIETTTAIDPDLDGLSDTLEALLTEWKSAYMPLTGAIRYSNTMRGWVPERPISKERQEELKKMALEAATRSMTRKR
ncbi:hypothetical protein [Flaviaesturariibacter terrae]